MYSRDQGWTSMLKNKFISCSCNTSVGIVKQTESSWSEKKCNNWLMWRWILEVLHNSLSDLLVQSHSQVLVACHQLPTSPAVPGLTRTLYLIQAWHYFRDFWLDYRLFDSHIQKCQRCGRNRAEHNGCQNTEVVMKIGCRLRFRKEKPSCSYLLHILL